MAGLSMTEISTGSSGPTSVSNGSNPGQSAAVLPAIPDPSSLWSSPGTSTLYLLQEAQAHIAQLRTLREHCQTGRIGYSLAPPPPGTLPPLPSIPIPRTSTVRSASSANGTHRDPNVRPPIPSSSRLYQTTDSDECLRAFNEENEGWSASRRYGREAICVRGRSMTVWALMRDTPEPRMLLHDIRVYNTGHTKGKGKAKEVPDLSSPGRNIMLSDHLSSLNLLLPELLYRLPHLPDLLRQPCYQCTKYLKVPDGLPYTHTGFLDRPTDACPTNRVGTDKKAEESDVKGRWVCWHESCSASL